MGQYMQQWCKRFPGVKFAIKATSYGDVYIGMWPANRKLEENNSAYPTPDNLAYEAWVYIMPPKGQESLDHAALVAAIEEKAARVQAVFETSERNRISRETKTATALEFAESL